MKNLLVILLVVGLFFGCGKSSNNQTPDSRSKSLKIAVVTNNSSDWWTIAKKGGDQAARELQNVEFDFRMLPEGTAAAQKGLVDDLIARKVDALLISPIDVENQKQMLDDAAAKTLLLTLGADAPSSNRALYVGSDDVESGRAAGEMIKKALPQGGKIMVFVGRRDAQNAIDRLNGLRQGIEGGNIELIDIRTDEADTAKAKINVADTLVKYPQIDGLVGLWSYNTPAIIGAVKDANKLGQVKIIGFDEDDQTLQGVKDGFVFATVVQQPYEFTFDAVKRATAILQGNKSQIPTDKKAIYPTQVVQQENVDKFWTQLKKLRGR
jgi:ribose transport system substrate-binding protein